MLLQVIWQTLESTPWAGVLASIVQDYSRKLREQLAVLLAKVYSTMALQKAAGLLNLDAQHTTACERLVSTSAAQL